MSDQQRRLVLVVGVGRSGTSLLAGVLGQLGLHIPVPEVKANDTNPRGFGEPRWAVDFHTRMLRRTRVTVNDSRPAAWEATGAMASDEALRAELGAWLREQFAQSPRVVVKDPRTVWFLPLWRACADDLGLQTSFVTMLREPAETVASAKKSYGDWQSDASRASAWLNMTLETEHSTRGTRRAFVRYEDLLGDWEREIRRVGELTGDPALAQVTRVGFPAVDEFVDPTLHRNRVDWDSHDVPAAVRTLADSVWEQVQGLARPGGDDAAAHARLDAARGAYATLYAEAEAIAQSSVTAAKRGRGKGGGKPAAPPTLRVKVLRRIPAPYRRRLRSALRSLRG
jgi:hypothetical protein